MKTFTSFPTLLLTLAVSGCRVAPPNISLHAGPASASAAESPLPSAAPILMTGNNYAMSPEGEGLPMEMDMDDMKGMKMDMPAHQHGGQKPAAPHQHEHHQDNPPKQ